MRRFSLAAMGSSAPAAPFLIDEDCEGTGTPSGWVTVNVTPNWDYSTLPIAGSQSLYMPMVGVSCRVRTNDLTGGPYSEIWTYFRLRLTNGTAPSTASVFFGYGTAGGASTFLVCQMLATLSMRPGTAGAGTTTLMSLDTDYHVWIHYLKGTGANAVVDCAFSTTGIRPTSGNNFKQVTNDTNTNDVGRVFLGGGVTTMGMDMVWDTIRVRNTQIGDNGV